MALYLLADHAGFELKSQLLTWLEKHKKDKFTNLIDNIIDITPKFVEGDDYPLQVQSLFVALKKLEEKEFEQEVKVIAVCGSGVGVCIALNRHPYLRAVNSQDVSEIKLAREHNDVNALCLPGRGASLEAAIAAVEVFLSTKKSPEARHQRRVRQLSELKI